MLLNKLLHRHSLCNIIYVSAFCFKIVEFIYVTKDFYFDFKNLYCVQRRYTF